MYSTEKCPNFAEVFDFVENGSGDSDTSCIDMNHIEAETMKEFLRFLYTGKVENMEELAISIYELAYSYYVEDLMDYCLSFIHYNVTPENAINVYVFAKQYHLASLLNRARSACFE